MQADYRVYIDRLLAYCREHDWAGYDPYDGLNSRIFPSAFSNRLMRIAWMQFFKRFPINLRRLAFVPPGHNPKGLALFAAALTRLGLDEEAAELLRRLDNMRSEGWEEACWGYNFDWQTRGILIRRGTPNVICTSFAGFAFLDAYEKSGNPEYLKTATSAGRFILKGLKRSGTDDEFCFSYTPLTPSHVHNASLLGAALLARVCAHEDIDEFRSAAMAAARHSMHRQNPDGSWPYGEHKTQQWVDSFHTGYNLLALRDIWKSLGSGEARDSLLKGFGYYRRAFFPGGGIVRYFNERTYPIDTHAVAHAILTLAELRGLDPTNMSLAQSILDWAVRHMRHPSGYFYYQKWPFLTNRISYMRWTQAWMLYAMACFQDAAGTR